MSKLLIGKKVNIPPNIGFVNEIGNKNMMFTFLSAEMRKVWLHHFMGARGVIVIYEGEEIKKANNELITYLSNQHLKILPILLIFDKSRISENKSNILNYETLRESMSKIKLRYNTLFVNMNDIKKESEFNYGLDWLESQTR